MFSDAARIHENGGIGKCCAGVVCVGEAPLSEMPGGTQHLPSDSEVGGAERVLAGV